MGRKKGFESLLRCVAQLIVLISSLAVQQPIPAYSLMDSAREQGSIIKKTILRPPCLLLNLTASLPH